MVYISFTMLINSWSGIVGEIRINGYPYPVSGGGAASLGLSLFKSPVTAQISNYIEFFIENTSNRASQDNFSNSGWLGGSGVYIS